MALLFELSVECGQRDAADAVAEYFRGQKWTPSSGEERICKASSFEHAESWWVRVTPSGLSRSGANSEEEAARMTEAGHRLYALLRGAPKYRYALVGVETEAWASYAELQDPDELDELGLVIHEKLWLETMPSEFEEFEPGYYWLPYEGEEYRAD